MSRHYLWEYAIGGPDAAQKWNQFFGDPCECEKVATHKYIQGGSGILGEWKIWIDANKAKARRLAERLDRHFGTTGTLRLSPIHGGER